MISIQKSSAGSNGKVSVTFAMPATDRCDCLYLVGWFDEWDESVYRMEQTADGTWSVTLELEPGCEYLYGFRTPDGKWLDDSATPPARHPLGLQHSFIINSAALDA